ncbi:MotA/TolQ/ExbB proton channel family protein [Gilvimarinus polysaccharolyticus]|uniref:MotA/TolQ/ExbB proton channel family protein n=1 Tax=Gilvimarinus polysaccharolyticus TaxID=863921 RepID=UPI0006738CA0|nr:MotA/TolQ/ExbB proton channel family protein [Gilvimarinus polysaccharolyticus]
MNLHWDNLIIWLIIVLAVVVYGLILDLLLQPQSSDWHQQVQHWLAALNPMLAALPLLGLLGTIAGLLVTFKGMASGQLDPQALLTTGIADALITTQLGLLMVVPGWMLLGWLRRRATSWSRLQVAQA